MAPPRRRAALLVLVAVLATTSPVLAAWIATSSGAASGRADSVLAAATPTVTAAGSDLTVSWSASTLGTGAPVGGYRVTRVDTVTAATTPATGACSGTVAGLSCVEAGVPTGYWAYRLEAVRGGWVGPLGSPSATVPVDATAPVVVRSAIVKREGGLGGAVRQGGRYFVYADVVDPGDPATGVDTVQADVSTITAGSTSVTMTAGSYTVGGQTYGWRSAQLRASSPQAEGSRTFTVTATDVAGNSSGPVAGPATVDNTRPRAVDVDVIDGAGTPGRPEAGDVLWVRADEALDPHSVIGGWDGSAVTVTVRLVNNGGGDRVQVRNAANTATLPLGTIFLDDTGYVSTTVNVPGSTLFWAGEYLVVVLGTPSGAVGTVTTTSTARWTPSTRPYDAAGNRLRNNAANESGPPDVQF